MVGSSLRTLMFMFWLAEAAGWLAAQCPLPVENFDTDFLSQATWVKFLRLYMVISSTEQYTFIPDLVNLTCLQGHRGVRQLKVAVVFHPCLCKTLYLLVYAWYGTRSCIDVNGLLCKFLSKVVQTLHGCCTHTWSLHVQLLLLMLFILYFQI